jgi:hypothetical protein
VAGLPQLAGKATVPLVIRSYHNLTGGMTMAQYKITIDKEELHQLFNQDQGKAKLVEKVVNKILEVEVTEKLQARPYERSGRPGPNSLPG